MRFVAADYEEQGNPSLEGARYYATWLKNQSTAKGFHRIDGHPPASGEITGGQSGQQRRGGHCAISHQVDRADFKQQGTPSASSKAVAAVSPKTTD